MFKPTKRNHPFAPSLPEQVQNEIIEGYLNPLIELYYPNQEHLLRKLVYWLVRWTEETPKQCAKFSTCSIALQIFSDFYKNKPDESLKETFQNTHRNIVSLYLDIKNFQQKMFPKCKLIAIQTFIREYLHNYLNPAALYPLQAINLTELAVFKPKTEKRGITHNKADAQNGSLFMQLPNEIKLLITAYLDIKSFFSLGKTCKNTYFFQESEQNKCLTHISENVFYIPLGHFRLNSEFPKEAITDQALLTAVPKKSKNIKLFPSLYQAIEYAQLRSKKDEEQNTKIMPTILTVLYLKNIKKLTYTETSIEIYYQANLGDDYPASKRKTVVNYVAMPNQDLLLLNVAVLVGDRRKPAQIGDSYFPPEEFAFYKICKIIDISARNKELTSVKEEGLKAQTCRLS